MKFEDLIKSLTPERYNALQRAVELGKWPDGSILGKEERETSLQVLIAYDVMYKQENERIGFVQKKECEIEHEMDSESSVIKNLIAKH